MTAYDILEAGPSDAATITDVSIRSYGDAFCEPFYMEREAALPRWERYMRGEHHPRHAKDPRIVYAAITDREMAGFIAGHLTERFGLEGELQSIRVSRASAAGAGDAAGHRPGAVVPAMGCPPGLRRPRGGERALLPRAGGPLQPPRLAGVGRFL